MPKVDKIEPAAVKVMLRLDDVTEAVTAFRNNAKRFDAAAVNGIKHALARALEACSRCIHEHEAEIRAATVTRHRTPRTAARRAVAIRMQRGR
jgi:hypothetical protein